MEGYVEILDTTVDKHETDTNIEEVVGLIRPYIPITPT